jgi:hypothetical protein
MLLKKLATAKKHGFIPILCVLVNEVNRAREKPGGASSWHGLASSFPKIIR